MHQLREGFAGLWVFPERALSGCGLVERLWGDAAAPRGNIPGDSHQFLWRQIILKYDEAPVPSLGIKPPRADFVHLNFEWQLLIRSCHANYLKRHAKNQQGEVVKSYSTLTHGLFTACSQPAGARVD
jgi:hypothetical protein